MTEVVKRGEGKKRPYCHRKLGSTRLDDHPYTAITEATSQLGGSNESSSSIGVMAVAEVLLLLARSFEGQGAVLEVLLTLFRTTSC